MPLVSSLVALVAAMRVRGLDRGACGPLADRRAAAAARRELAGHLLLAVLVWRNGWLSSMITKAAACWSWCLSITNSFITAHLARASSFDVLVLVGEVRMQAVLHTDGILLLKNMRRGLVFGVGQLVLHVENGLIEIFLSVCGSSAPVPSCWDERRWQTSCAAAVLLAEWRERGSCITACLHLNPSMALTTALANSFRLREAAAVVASGGDAGDDGGDGGVTQQTTTTCS